MTNAVSASEIGKKSKSIFKINRTSYQKVDCIGRGGSGKVYRVKAANGDKFALKRISFRNADKHAIMCFKREPCLLRELSDVEHVIQLYDSELDEERHILSLLLEIGELDLDMILKARQSPEGRKLDLFFIRFYWKEMLECLAAVHSRNIVHSDLKPANFVLVQGRLKLIDFGIADAIPIADSVYVHRETQVGTPNYMSPESLMDCKHNDAVTDAPRGRCPLPRSTSPKLIKIGKPSDIWSMGCMLYQMVYGSPPFGQLQNEGARCRAIINWNYQINFPGSGLGGVQVPNSLMRTMECCLQREYCGRPTCAELLSEDDPFLYPIEYAVDAADE